MSQTVVHKKNEHTVGSSFTREHVLVVPRVHLFGGETAPSGFVQVDMQEYLKRVRAHRHYMVRADAEVNPAYKQIIPYFIFTYKNTFFLMRRGGSSNEGRLHHRYTFGIGGHVRAEDTRAEDTIVAWGMREFHEEVLYTGELTVEPLGMVNDESNEVGQVHTGFVYLLRGSSSAISIRSELVWGKLLTLNECAQYYESLETWSRMVYDVLRAKNTCV